VPPAGVHGRAAPAPAVTWLRQWPTGRRRPNDSVRLPTPPAWRQPAGSGLLGLRQLGLRQLGLQSRYPAVQRLGALLRLHATGCAGAGAVGRKGRAANGTRVGGVLRLPSQAHNSDTLQADGRLPGCVNWGCSQPALVEAAVSASAGAGAGGAPAPTCSLSTRWLSLTSSLSK
jgi:hypothetical protein